MVDTKNDRYWIWKLGHKTIPKPKIIIPGEPEVEEPKIEETDNIVFTTNKRQQAIFTLQDMMKHDGYTYYIYDKETRKKMYLNKRESVTEAKQADIADFARGIEKEKLRLEFKYDIENAKGIRKIGVIIKWIKKLLSNKQ